MEWVETTGRTIDEAKEAALDELGVDAQDAEFEILEEPRLGLFGRLRTEGRVRARVRPSTPRAKEDRRDRRRRSRSSHTPSDPGETTEGPASETDAPVSTPVPRPTGTPPQGGNPSVRRRDQTSPRSRPDPGRGPAETVPTPPSSTDDGETDGGDTNQGGSLMDVALDQQAEMASTFLRGLLDHFGATAHLTVTTADDDERIDIRVDGDNLGILIGPKGSTLLAIQDLTRTFVQHRTSARNGRIHLDISGYRDKRSKALAAFTEKVAAEVLTTGRAVALEPMSPPDRKVVHDTVGRIVGVESRSEGEDDRRHVVISCQAPAAETSDHPS